MLPTIRGLWCRLRARFTGGRLRIGRNFRAGVRFDVRGPGHVIVGDDVVLGRLPGDTRSFVTIYTHSPDAVVRIGNRARLYAARISCRYSVETGEDVLIEDAGISDTDFHSVQADRGEPVGETLDRCRIAIGDRVAIGARSIVTKGTVIGEAAIVGPGAVVTRSLPAGCFAMGNPAKVMAVAARPAASRPTGGDVEGNHIERAI